MERFQSVVITAPEKQWSAFERIVAEWSSRGYRFLDQPTRLIPSRTLLVSPLDRRWKREANAAMRAGAIEEWEVMHIETVYSKADIASADVFNAVHMGRCIEFKTDKDHISRVCDIADWDLTKLCHRCGVGARQAGSLRIPAAELNKAGRIASIWLAGGTFWMFSHSLMREMQKSCDERIPVREVEEV